MRHQIFVNESRVLDTTDGEEAHKVLSIIERIFSLTKADGTVQIQLGEEMREREYFKGGLIGVPSSLAMQIDDIAKSKDKFGG